MANRQFNPFYRFALVAIVTASMSGLVSPSFADDLAVNSTPETTASTEVAPIETPVAPAAEETPQKEVSAAVEPATLVVPAPLPEPAPAAPAAPIQEHPAAELAGPVTDQTLVVAAPPSGVAAEVPAETGPVVVQTPSFSLDAFAISSQVYGTGYFTIQQTNPFASNGHQLTATINGNGSFVGTFRERTLSFSTDAQHGGFSTEYVMCVPEGVLITVTDAAGNVVASKVGPGNTRQGASVLPRYCPGAPTEPTKETVIVTPEGADVTLAGEGIRGSVVPKGTPGVVYTVDKPDAFEGVVTVTATPAPEDASFKYVFPVGVTTSWTYDLGVYTDPKPVDPNPGNDPADVGSYSSGTFAPTGTDPYIYGGTLTAKGEFGRDANISFVVTDASGKELSSKDDFGPWDGKDPLSLDQVNLAAHCGKTITWAWLETSTSENASSQVVLFHGSIALAACPPNPSDGSDGSEDGEGDHENGGWVPDDTDQPGGWNGHVGGPGFYGPGHPDNVNGQPVVMTPVVLAGVEASAVPETDSTPLASVGSGEINSDASDTSDDTLAKTGLNASMVPIALLLLIAGLLMLRRRGTAVVK